MQNNRPTICLKGIVKQNLFCIIMSVYVEKDSNIDFCTSASINTEINIILQKTRARSSKGKVYYHKVNKRGIEED